MTDFYAIFCLAGAVTVLAFSHGFAFRAGRKRREVTASEVCIPATEPAPAGPVLVVDNGHPALDALRGLDADFIAVPAYVETLLRQIEGVKADAEEGIAQVISEVGTINGQASEQIGRMHASLDSSEALARSNERPRQIISSLQSTLHARTEQLRTNFASLSDLAHQFETLRPLIGTISTIADKAFFLSINAAVEAARAGSGGAAFALVAGEMRALSTLTQTAAKDIGEGIATFTSRMHGELDRARPQVEGSSSELEQMIGELGEIQGNLAMAGSELTAMIQSMDSGHSQMVERLSSILGHVQFQDVIRQRLDQVGESIGELGEHVSSSVRSARSGNANARLSLEQRLEAQQSRYVMHSQRAAFAQASGGGMLEDAAPRIELF